MSKSDDWVPLWCKSHYSFREGASSPEELVGRAAERGFRALALTDRVGLYGMVRAHVAAKAAGLKLLHGAELAMLPSSAASREVPLGPAPIAASEAARVVVLARNARGYAGLCRVLTAAHARGDKGEAWTHPEDLDALAGDAFVLATSTEGLARLRPVMPRESLRALVARQRAPGEAPAERALRALAADAGVDCVAGREVLYHQRARRPLQDVLTCVRHGVPLTAAGRLLRPNDEHDLLDPGAFRSLFEDDPRAVARTAEIADACDFDLGALRYVYPSERLPAGESEESWLRHLAFRGAARRYPEGLPDDVRAQLERELAVIEDLAYGGYFLTMHEIVEHCAAEGILAQGRGSAANSAVCFCLGITAIDPVRMDLLFERFLSRERAEPPDIDLDIEHERREEVIQHVYARYGRRHSAMVANAIRYRPRSAVREVGKVLGLTATDLDGLARLVRHRDDALDASVLRDAGLDPAAPVHRHLLRLSGMLLDTPRHLGIHPGGFLLGHLPVDELVPVEPATMEGRTVIQWDKYDVEALGLFKVDLLGLGALTCIRKAFGLIEEAGGPALSIATVPQEDPETYAMCSRGDTVGVFQIESRAQMAMLPRMKPRTFYDLVIEVAIVRPGPIQGDMVHPYLRRRHGEEPVVVPHPKLAEVLAKTLGVPIFQEQVMKLAVVAAGYTPGAADQLRRGLAAWRSQGKIEQHRDRMLRRMVDGGIPADFAERVFSQIRGFGEYGFPESHAASFALLAYVTSWLKCHHPAAFTCALLNAQPMGFYSPATIIEDAKRRRVDVLPIDVRRSGWESTLEATGPGDGPRAVRIGLGMVKGFGVQERDAMASWEQPMEGLEDLVRRSGFDEGALLALAEAGALEGFGVNRRDALWRLRGLVRAKGDALALGDTSQLSFPSLGEEEAVLWDYRASGHSTRGHPLGRFRAALEAQRMPDARRLNALEDGARVRFVGQVICRQRPQTASGVNFYTLEDETGLVNLVLWKQVAARHRTVAKTAVFLGVAGRIQRAHGVVHLVAERLFAGSEVLETAPAAQSRGLVETARELGRRSRDFH